MSLTHTFWFEAKIFKIVDTAPRNISIKIFYSDSSIDNSHFLYGWKENVSCRDRASRRDKERKTNQSYYWVVLLFRMSLWIEGSLYATTS